jgi:hypothetical protein
MSFILQANSSSQVTLEPEYDYARTDAKIENEHRTRSGDRYVYNWGRYRRIKFSIRYVDSATMNIVNNWWRNDTKLEFYEQGTTDITSCQLTNSTIPIGEFVRPYTNLFEGRVELEEY